MSAQPRTRAYVITRRGKRGTSYQVKVRRPDGTQSSVATYPGDRQAALDHAALINVDNVVPILTRDQARHGAGDEVAAMPFRQWWEQCIAQSPRQASTLDRHRRALSTAWGDLDDVPVGNITTELLRELLRAQGAPTAAHPERPRFAVSTRRVMFSIVRKYLIAARRSGAFANGRSPHEGIELPEADPVHDQFLTAEQVALLAECMGAEHGIFVLLGGYCGLRPGETLALTWRDVEWNALDPDGVEFVNLHVRRTIAKAQRLYEKQGTKAARLGRAVPVPGFVVDVLAAHYDAQVLAGGGDVDDRILPAPGGRFAAYWDPSTFRRQVWLPAVKAARARLRDRKLRGQPLPAKLVPHTLRHTAVSLWIAAGGDVKEISARAGHTSVAYTLDKYAHRFASRSRALDGALDATARAAAKALD